MLLLQKDYYKYKIFLVTIYLYRVDFTYQMEYLFTIELLESQFFNNLLFHLRDPSMDQLLLQVL